MPTRVSRRRRSISHSVWSVFSHQPQMKVSLACRVNMTSSFTKNEVYYRSFAKEE